jgi:transposase-like protein
MGGPKKSRKTKVSVEDEVLHRLSCKFTNDFLYMCIYYDLIQKQQIFKSIHYKVKNMSTELIDQMASITTADIDKAMKNHADDIPDEKSNFVTRHLQLAGRNASFSQFAKQTNRSELKSMLIRNGPPSWYITFSPADTKHLLAYQMCFNDPANFDPDAPEISDAYFRSSQASANPTALSEFFFILVSKIINNLMGWKNPDRKGVLGVLKGYYGMVETQNRGTLHIHMIVFLEGSPDCIELYDKLKNSESFKNEILAYVTSVVSTGVGLDVPVENTAEEKEILKKFMYYALISTDDFDNNPDIRKLLLGAIQTYQLHIHTLSCSKNPNLQGKCRYRKPCPTCLLTHFDEITGGIILEKANGMINNFNKWITAITNSNTDIQFIISGTMGLAIVHYITNYITKNSVGIESIHILQKAALEHALECPFPISNPANSPEREFVRAFYIRFFMNLIKCSQVSATEVATKLLCYPMCYKSHEFTSVGLFSVQSMVVSYKVFLYIIKLYSRLTWQMMVFLICKIM